MVRWTYSGLDNSSMNFFVKLGIEPTVKIFSCFFTTDIPVGCCLSVGVFLLCTMPSWSYRGKALAKIYTTEKKSNRQTWEFITKIFIFIKSTELDGREKLEPQMSTEYRLAGSPRFDSRSLLLSPVKFQGSKMAWLLLAVQWKNE